MTSGDTALFSHHRPALPALQAGESLEQHDLMMLGKPYLASDPFLSRYRDIAADQFAAVSAERSMDRRMEVLNRVCDMRGGPGQEKVFIAAPFTFEYGRNISFGPDVYVGPNCTFIDVCPILSNFIYCCIISSSHANHLNGCEWGYIGVNTVYVGHRTMFGAGCQILTPTHPISPEERNGISGPEWAKRIHIGDDCWFGGSVIVLPGVRIGNGCTIGAGAVVTKDIPDRSIAVGNPARVIKTINLDGTTSPVGKA